MTTYRKLAEENDVVGASDICIVCMNNAADRKLNNCKHRQMCLTCINALKTFAINGRRSPKCPTCRLSIDDHSSCPLQLEELPVSEVFQSPLTNSATGNVEFNAGSSFTNSYGGDFTQQYVIFHFLYFTYLISVITSQL
jgi:hypothetical protein